MKILSDSIFNSREAMALYAIIFQNPGIISTEIANKAGRKGANVSRGLKNLRDEGLVIMKLTETQRGQVAKSYYPSLAGLLEKIFHASFTKDEAQEIDSILLDEKIRAELFKDVNTNSQKNMFEFVLLVIKFLTKLSELLQKDTDLNQKFEKVVKVLNKHGI